MNLSKYMTTGVMKDINNFVETQTQVPFTVKNIYRMFEIIFGTREQTFNRALVETVDDFTTHTHENRFSVEGWKTNSGHMLNKKFIINWGCESNYSGGMKISTGKLTDLEKVLCHITGTDHDNINSIVNYSRTYQTNTWYYSTFFEFKCFKKRTVHLKFKDDKVWEQINRAYAKIKGEVLPEKI